MVEKKKQKRQQKTFEQKGFLFSNLPNGIGQRTLNLTQLITNNNKINPSTH